MPIELELPDEVHRVAEQIERGWRMLASAEATAAYICSTGEVGRGLAALPVVAALKARHVPREWVERIGRFSEDAAVRDVRIVVCDVCNVAWPCADAEILAAAA